MGLTSKPLEFLKHLRDRRRIKRMPHAVPNSKAVYHAWLQIQRYPQANRNQAMEIELGETILHGQTWEEVSYLFEEVFVHNEYYTETPIKDPFIVDCGANIGFASVYFKLQYPNARILAFEPNPYCFDVLQRNIRENKFEDVMMVKAGCSNEVGKTSFHVNPGFSPMSSMDATRNEDSEEVEVELVRLSDHLHRPVDLLKMDIEGAEWLVMDDLVKNDKLGMIDRFFIEYHHRVGTPEVKLSKFLTVLEEAGYTYALHTTMNIERRFTGVFQDVMIYAVKLDKIDAKKS